MARLNTFFLSPDKWPAVPGESVLLDGTEARHMLTVLRTDKDQTVRLFDGQGNDGLFRVESVSKRKAVLEALELSSHSLPSSGVTLAIGWGKSKRRNYFFEKLVELKGLGVAFWKAHRSQGSLPSDSKDAWNEKCLQAAKQCGNPHLPNIRVLTNGLDELVEFTSEFDQCFLAWESDEATVPLSPASLSNGKSLVIIGPEGGLEQREAQKLIDADCRPVTLGESILRWETAASYCLSLAHCARQEKK